MQYVNNGRNVKHKKKRKFTIGYFILLMAVVIFIIRALVVIRSHNERGGLAYVQLLNFSMPIVEEQIYDSTAYRENSIGIKRVVEEALGIRNINTYSVIGSEISLFSGLNIEGNDKTSKSPFSIFTPFEVDEESIAKMTEDNIKELSAVSEAYDTSLKAKLEPSDFKVLIYHTHTREGYAEVNGASENEDFSVVGVGNVIESELEEGYGVSVVHDKTVHDTSPYEESYYRSEVTVQRYLDEFGDFDLIIDLHRDGGPKKADVTTTIDDKNLAKLMFVTSKSSPNYNEMIKKVNTMIEFSNTLFPTLLRREGLYEYNGGSNKFNQMLSPNSILVEFGANVNTAQEAKLSAKYLSRIIAEYLNTVE